ncbi:MAG: PRC-barrel domain-containing protein [Shimia sp.]
MTPKFTLLTSAAAIALMTSGAVAQTASNTEAGEMNAVDGVVMDDGTNAQMTSPADMDGEMRMLTVADLVGMAVRGQDGDRVGEIDYVIGDSQGYEAVIGVGGFLGLGEYTVALPLDRFSRNGDMLMVSDLTEEELRAMPEIDESALNELDGDVVLEGMSVAALMPRADTEEFADVSTEVDADAAMSEGDMEMADAETDAPTRQELGGNPPADLAEAEGTEDGMTTTTQTVDVTNVEGDMNRTDEAQDMEGTMAADADGMMTPEEGQEELAENSGMMTEGTETELSTDEVADAATDTQMIDDGTMGDDTVMAEGETDMQTDAEMGEDSMMAEGSDEMETTTETVTVTDADGATTMDTMSLDTFEGMTVSQLIGMPVDGESGDRVGEIDYIIEQADGLAAVIGVGGFLGLGEYTVALPLDRFERTEDRLMLTGMSEEELRAMPEIDESELTALDGEMRIQ